MRASKAVQSPRSKVQSPNRKIPEIHISGAEGLYEKSDIERILERYIKRAFKHPKGTADKVVITIEDIKQMPRMIRSLPVSTVKCRTPAEGKVIIAKILQSIGIPNRSIEIAFEIIKEGNMRGAAIITAEKGDRLEPDRERGVRVSRLGINKSALKVLSLRLSKYGIDKDVVKEAVILASKVLSCKNILAEVCVSDDPYYTTGYVASKKFGYLRIPHIKHEGSKIGGRAFFVKEVTHVDEIKDYLEKKAVMIDKVAPCKGTVSINEILGNNYI
ncbi:MAG: 6-carboxyhexanoate--CoA ligase [Nitrospirae bacterium]|nr:6-carboxyhexanoate--CoA ligase [Nitrospirota bacterium]